MQLNSKEAANAWDDYKEFLMSLGIFKMGNPHTWQQLEQAFKFGYAKGVAEGEKKQPAYIPPMEQTPANTVLELKEVATGRRRSEEELMKDAEIVKAILKRHGEPMQLQAITAAANKAGCKWYHKSSSSHMAKVMEQQPEVKKVGYGVYVYQEKQGKLF